MVFSGHHTVGKFFSDGPHIKWPVGRIGRLPWETKATTSQRMSQDGLLIIYTLWLFNIAMENEPFIDDVPIKMVIFHGYVK